MLQVISSISDRQDAQEQLREMLQSELPFKGKRNVGFRGGAVLLRMYGLGDGALWYAHQELTDVTTPRHWNAFGLSDPNRNIEFITVEINIPTSKKENGVAGFFAKDVETGETYLMHTGRVGGGRRGIGKGAFLAWSRRSPEEVIEGQEKYRLGLIVSPLDKRVIAERIGNFVQQVAAFKEAAVAGELDSPDFRKRVEEIEKYNRNFPGRKGGKK